MKKNKNVSDIGLSYIEGVQDLNIQRNEIITDDGLKYLRGIKKLNIKNNLLIKNLKLLKGIEYLGFR